MELKTADAIGITDEVLATQRRCHENISWYHNFEFKNQHHPAYVQLQLNRYV